MVKVITLAMVLLLLCGCKGGGGGGTTSDPGSNAYYSDSSSGSGSTTDNYVPGDNTMVNPEPSSMILLGIGLAGLAAAAKKRKK